MTRLFTTLVLSMLLAGSHAVANSNQPTGIIEGVVDGAEHTWYTFRIPDSQVTPTAYWFDIMGMFTSVSIQGHSELRYSLQDSFVIEFTLYDSPPACPCEVGDALISFWPGAERYPHYYAEDASIDIVEFAEIGEGAYRLAGTYEAVLALKESMFGAPDTDDTVTVSGSFTVDWLPEDLQD